LTYGRGKLYFGLREANPMKRTSALFTLLCAALTAQAASTSTSSVQNVRFGQESGPVNVVTPPKVLTHPAAAYTDEARKRGIQGNVIVQAYFDENGNVTVLKLVKGLGYGLDETAIAALQGWRFSPALRDGLPVSAIADIEVPFRLHDFQGLTDVVLGLRPNEATDTVLKLPTPIAKVDVIYPQGGEEAGLQGTVVLEWLVRPDGSVGEIRVVRGLTSFATSRGLMDADFDANAIAAIRQWRFQPATREGALVEYPVIGNVNFHFRPTN
jgi:TonB family protein